MTTMTLLMAIVLELEWLCESDCSTLRFNSTWSRGAPVHIIEYTVSTSDRPSAGMCRQPSITPILFGTDVLHPIHHLAIQSLGDSDVRHGSGSRSAVPMFLAGFEPNHVAGSD